MAHPYPVSSYFRHLEGGVVFDDGVDADERGSGELSRRQVGKLHVGEGDTEAPRATEGERLGEFDWERREEGERLDRNERGRLGQAEAEAASATDAERLREFTGWWERQPAGNWGGDCFSGALLPGTEQLVER
eukprot:scaffold19537_cov77-Isochrysis_galbana.AAC.1